MKFLIIVRNYSVWRHTPQVSDKMAVTRGSSNLRYDQTRGCFDLSELAEPPLLSARKRACGLLGASVRATQADLDLPSLQYPE